MKKLTVIGLVIVFIATIAGVRLFRDSHAHSIKYNDAWIIGKTRSQIEQRYGKLDRMEYGTLGYDLPNDSFYVIEFDDQGYAEGIYRGVK